MSNLKLEILKIFKSNKYFFILYIVFLVLGFFTFFQPREVLTLLINKNHNLYFDFFFKYITNLGDGFFIGACLLVLVFIKFRYALYILISYLSGGLFAQILKRIFDTPRPKTYIMNSELLHYVSGVDVYAFHSFPSGHAATAFSAFLFFSILVKNNFLKFLFFIFAFFIGISRIYLLQHFFIDVYFGSIIGVLFTFITFFLINKIKDSSWIDKSLIAAAKKK